VSQDVAEGVHGARLADLGVRRPQRADARRNFDALLAAAREVFSEQGADASLEDVAKRAGVGIGTLYRNFPTRRDLFERVYIGEIEELCAAADELADADPWTALTGWLDRFVRYIATKRALMEALNWESPVITTCRQEMFDCGTPLLRRAQEAGSARADLSFDELIKLVAGVTSGKFTDDAQRDRVLQIALDGVRTGR
jgi:AcrR family transcriptional regulator